MPTIAELRAFEDQVKVPVERIEAAYERRKAQILAAPEVKALPSVQDEKAAPRREIRQLTEAELTARLDELKFQAANGRRQ